jgi:hypothetical protein
MRLEVVVEKAGSGGESSRFAERCLRSVHGMRVGFHDRPHHFTYICRWIYVVRARTLLSLPWRWSLTFLEMIDRGSPSTPPHDCDPEKHASSPRHSLAADMESISRISGLLETGMYAFQS